MNQLLELDHAWVWRGADASIAALRDVCLTFQRDENVAILGPNGSGKSTLLKLISGALRIEARENAKCLLFGEEFWAIETLRHHIGLVMPEEVSRFAEDEPAFHVVLSVFRGAYGVTPDMHFKRTEREAASRAVDSMGIEKLINRGFGKLSSGERRRFLIARALAHDPDVLVLDEPTTALDFPSAVILQKSLRELAKRGKALIWVTHHPGEIPPEIERVILLNNGEIFADGPKLEILNSRNMSRLYNMPVKVRWSGGWCHVTS